MRRSVLLVTALAVVLGAAPACSDKTGGSAVPDGSTGVPAGNSTTTTTTSGRPTSGGNSPLAGKDPCSLLTTSAQGSLGISGGETHNVGAARGCQWKLRATTGDLYLYGVAIYDKSGIKDIPSDTTVNKLPNIGKHEAVQSPAKQGGSCSVILGLTESSQVATTVTAGTNLQKGCELALQMAQLVEPELP